MADADLLIGGHADGVAIFEDGAVFQKVVGNIDGPFTQVAGWQVDGGNLDGHS